MSIMSETVLAIKHIFQVLAYFFNPRLRKKKDREKVWNEFKTLEKNYKRALAIGDPISASELDKRMRELRKKYTYLNR